MTVIQQGDQYLLEFEIKEDGTAVTPSDVDDLCIKVGGVLKTYAKSEITYSNSKWYYPLTRSQTLEYDGSILDVQASIKKDGTIRSSIVVQSFFNKSIITEEW